MQHQGDLGTHGEHRRGIAANLKFEISQQATGVYAVRSCLSSLAFLRLLSRVRHGASRMRHRPDRAEATSSRTILW